MKQFNLPIPMTKSPQTLLDLEESLDAKNIYAILLEIIVSFYVYFVINVFLTSVAKSSDPVVLVMTRV